jgi:hypothetical protein
MAGDRPDEGVASVRADYLRGDQAEVRPMTRGRLELESGELRFSVPGGTDMRIDLRSLEGLTVSGRSPYERPRRHARGTMLIAARRNGTVDVWEFAVERKAGAALRDRIHRELHATGVRRPPLPFVEQLVGPVPPLGEESPDSRNGHTSGGADDERNEPGDAPAADDRRLRRQDSRALLIAFTGAAIVAAEVLAVVLLVG